MSNRNTVVVADCDSCKRSIDRRQRQALGCGYEPMLDRVHLTMWRPPSGSLGYQGPEPTVCPGYTSNLPEVREVVLAKIHWDTGNLTALGPVNEDLLNAIVIYTGAYNAVQRWAMTPSKDGGGGP